MTRTLSEQQVLDKLNISSFRELSRKGVVDFVSNLSKLDPEVAKKALEQVPCFVECAKEAINQIKAFSDESLKSNDASANEFYKECHYVIGILEKFLERPDLSQEERTFVISEIVSILDMIDKKDTEHRQGNETLTKYFIGGSLFLLGSILTIIGVNTHFDSSALSA